MLLLLLLLLLLQLLIIIIRLLVFIIITHHTVYFRQLGPYKQRETKYIKYIKTEIHRKYTHKADRRTCRS